MSFVEQFTPYKLEGPYIDSCWELDAALRIVGAAYVDSHQAYTLMHDRLKKRRQKEVKALAADLGPEAAERVFGTLDHLFHPVPEDALKLPRPLEYLSTPAEQMKRNSADGGNLGTLGNMCLVFLYAVWEEKIRRIIARHHGVDESEITSDIWGEIGKIRNAIAHRRAIADKDIAKCKLLKWFRDGDAILITPPRFVELLAQIVRFENEELESLIETKPSEAAVVRAPFLAKMRAKNQLNAIRQCDPALLTRAMAVFGNEDTVLQWLTAPQAGLKNRSPLESKPAAAMGLLEGHPAASACRTVNHDAIARRAYELWMMAGNPQGCDRQHWLQAETELLAVR